MKPKIKREVAISKLNDIFFAAFYTIPLLRIQYPVEVYYLDLINRYIPRIPVANHIDLYISTENYIFKLIDKKSTHVTSFLDSKYPEIENTMNSRCLVFHHEIRHLTENIVSAIADYNYWVLALASWAGFCKSLVPPNEMANILLTINFIKEEYYQIGFDWMPASDINYVPLPYSLFKR